MNACYTGVVSHARSEPVTNRFRYDTRMWLVDLDDPPTLPRGARWLARWSAADHVGDPRASLRRNIEAEFGRQGADVSGCRLLMLAHPRGAGHGFNPISVHWALDRRTGQVRAVLAEVHNTYGGRTAYLLDGAWSEQGAVTAEVGKQLYVSPFYDTDGRYTIRVSPPGERITVTVRYAPETSAPFTASLTLDRQGPARPSLVMRSAADAWRTSALIRVQGIKLWARGLRIHPRPLGHDRELSRARVPEVLS